MRNQSRVVADERRQDIDFGGVYRVEHDNKLVLFCQTTLTENYSLLVLYGVVNLSVYFCMKRTGSENMPLLSVGHDQK